VLGVRVAESCRRLLKVATGIALCMVVSILSAYAGDASPDGSLRSKKWEVLLSPQYTLSKDLGFDGGTTAKINDTWGFGLQFGYNFNAHWNLGGIFSWNNPDYQAVVQPAAGNTSPPRSISGTVETTTFALAVTYNVLTSPLTPYLDTNIGGTYVYTDIAAGPPVAGCFWDPWYGYVCGVGQPTKADTFLSFGVGGGLRWDINRYLLLRGGIRQQWSDLPNTGIPSFTIFKLDVGFKF